MIRHIVLVRFQPTVSPAVIDDLFTELHQIEGKVPGLLSITSGRSESPERIERGYLHGFVADFTDWAAPKPISSIRATSASVPVWLPTPKAVSTASSSSTCPS
jgi:hypothetical protein